MKSLKKLEANIEIFLKLVEGRMDKYKYSQVVKTSTTGEKVFNIDICDSILNKIDYQSIYDKYEDIRDRYKYIGVVNNLLINRIIDYTRKDNWYYVYTFLYFMSQLYKDIKIDISLSKLEYLNSNLSNVDIDACSDENKSNEEHIDPYFQMKKCCDTIYKNLSFVIFNDLKMNNSFIVIDDLKSVESYNVIEQELEKIEKKLG